MTAARICLRPYRPEDLPELERLFYETVHGVCCRDYTPEQCNAWAPAQVDRAAWNASFLENDTLVAVEGEAIAGFADMASGGYLDRLYVRKDRQGCGIASALCGALEARSSAAVLTVHASITARSFFERRGYRVIHSQTTARKGVELANYAMEKRRSL